MLVSYFGNYTTSPKKVAPAKNSYVWILQSVNLIEKIVTGNRGRAPRRFGRGGWCGEPREPHVVPRDNDESWSAKIILGTEYRDIMNWKW